MGTPKIYFIENHARVMDSVWCLSKSADNTQLLTQTLDSHGIKACNINNIILCELRIKYQ